MSHNQLTTERLVAPLVAASGGFVMLALDQRESLRRMFPVVDGREASDEALREFKLAAIRALTSLASGVLLDRPLAVMTDRPAGIATGCGLILAADVLEQRAGEGVHSTSLDPLITVEFIHHVGAVALKLLVIWRPDGNESAREELVRSFVAVADAAGIASLVEGIVRPVDGEWSDPRERHAAILEAARELASYGGTIYKAEVPGYLPGDLSLVREHAELLTESIDCPWVVLSNGVEREDFAESVRLACEGGARGFLAGRAIWADTVAEEDHVAALDQRSAVRLRELTAIVAEALRP
jgi:sulfofructosephosphate aldolase